MREEVSIQLEKALDSMSEIDREILAMRHFEELTNSEVDEVLGIQQKAAAYFLEIRKGDPAPGFLARFTGNQPPVRPGSEFETGKGLSFRVNSI